MHARHLQRSSTILAQSTRCYSAMTRASPGNSMLTHRQLQQSLLLPIARLSIVSTRHPPCLTRAYASWPNPSEDRYSIWQQLTPLSKSVVLLGAGAIGIYALRAGIWPVLVGGLGFGFYYVLTRVPQATHINIDMGDEDATSRHQQHQHQKKKRRRSDVPPSADELLQRWFSNARPGQPIPSGTASPSSLLTGTMIGWLFSGFFRLLRHQGARMVQLEESADRIHLASIQQLRRAMSTRRALLKQVLLTDDMDRLRFDSPHMMSARQERSTVQQHTSTATVVELCYMICDRRTGMPLVQASVVGVGDEQETVVQLRRFRLQSLQNGRQVEVPLDGSDGSGDDPSIIDADYRVMR